MTLARMEEMDWPIVLVSAHLGARTGDGGENHTNHFWWQGKFYRRDVSMDVIRQAAANPSRGALADAAPGDGEAALLQRPGTESALTGQTDGGIIDKKTPPEEKPDVHTVGHIDREIYKCVTEDIQTDEVIITDERIAHIRERHPGAYEGFSAYLKEIVEDPDYILPGNRKNTAIILKEIASEGKEAKMVLWLSTSGDKPEYKNSIMTLVKIDRADWERLLRNKKILYRRK